MKYDHLSTLLQLRFLVGFLGERSNYAWWPTSFYEESSQLFLEPVFSKTFRAAQYHGVLEAARRLHDEHLSLGSFHLFRLPEEVEQDLHTAMTSSVGGEFASQLLRSKEHALAALKQLATTPVLPDVGPKVVGKIENLESTDTLKAIATTYLSAFTQSAKAYPYLVA